MRQFARVARGQNGQLFSLVLGEKARRVALCKNPDRLICPDRQGQDRAYGRTVDARRRHRLSEHSTPREIYNAAPRAPAARGLPYQSAATMRPRRNERLATLARGLVPLCFSVFSGSESAFLFGPRSPIKLSGSFNRRGLSVAWPCSIYSAAPLIQSVVLLFDTQAPCLCRARRSRNRVVAILAAESLPCLFELVCCQ